MTNIVERLREYNEPPFDYIAHEAANKIERLRKLLGWWLYSSTVDATIMGPIFRGVSGSRKEVWQATLDEFELEEKKKGEINMTVSMDKKYVTRDGKHNAKVIYIHDNGDYPVIAILIKKNTEYYSTAHYTLSGKCFTYHGDRSIFDLIEVPEEKPEVFVSKKWREITNNQDKCIIYHQHLTGVYPIHRAIKTDDGDYKSASWTSDGLYVLDNYTHPNNLIEVPEATQDGWIEFDAETDVVPFLHMHDMLEVKYDNGYQSLPVPAWSVDFDSSRYPVVAYRVVIKADASEIERAL